MNFPIFTYAQYCLMFLSLLSLISCGKIPVSYTTEENGSLIIKSRIVNSLAKRSAVLESTFDSLIIEIDASDFDTPIHWSTEINKSSPAIVDTIASIPVGPSRIVKIWTVNHNGTIIHRDSIASHTVTIEPGKATPITAVLLPAIGSLYLQIGSVPTTVDSVRAVFTSTDGIKSSTTIKRSARIYLTINNIPHLAEGVLVVQAIDPAGVVLYTSETPIIFNAFKSENIILNFNSKGGSLALNSTIVLPGTIVATGNLGTTEVAASESGPCIITEIMYAANDSEYIEICNISTKSVNYDTLILEIDGTRRFFTNITIEPGKFYVFGRKGTPWVDQTPTVVSALDLSSNGNWITLRYRDVILDQVIFSSASKGLEWPSFTGKRSIELQKTMYSGKLNNFGRNWTSASTLIASTNSIYGTPGY